MWTLKLLWYYLLFLVAERIGLNGEVWHPNILFINELYVKVV